MRAPLIALVLVIFGAGAYYFFQIAQQRPVATTSAGASTLQSSDPTLSIFSDVCVEGRQNFAESERRAIAAGWVVAPDDVNPSLAHIMSISRAAASQMPGGILHAYSHAGRSQYIVLTSLVVSGIPANGCYVYNFGASQLPDVSAMEARLGAPTEVTSQAGVAEIRAWTRPSALSDVAALRLAYFPPGSPAETQVGFSGLAFSMTSFSR